MSYADDYDRQAEATGWLGPEAVFGLMYEFVQPGDTILDIGVGTGLASVLFHKAGLCVYGMDSSEEMLTACRSKGFAADLTQHDLTSLPYPYGDASIDHVICVGVLNFFEDLRLVFQETGRLLQDGGLFAFVVAIRNLEEEAEFIVGPEHTGSNRSVTMYRHSMEQVRGLLKDNDFVLIRDLEFVAYMDADKAIPVRSRAYLGRRNTRS